MANETAMDALNAALGDSAVASTETPDEEVIVDGDADAGADEGVVSPDGEGAADESEGAEGEGAEGAEGEGAQGAEGEGAGEPAAPVTTASEAERLGVSKNRPNGTFKTKTEFEADVKTAQTAEKAAAAAKPVEKKGAVAPQLDANGKPISKKAADPLNDPIPADLKQETQARIRTLIDRTKAAEEGHADIQRNFAYLVEGVKQTGATPEQYGETLEFLTLFNSTDPTNQGKALEIIEGLADRLATMLGVERKLTDPMAAHPDLTAAVQKGQLTAQYAKEVARTRNQGAFRNQMQTAASTQQQQEQAAAQAKEAARVDMNTLEESLRASDPLYEQKKAAIMPTLKIMFPQINPAQWKATFQQLYREVKVAPRVLTRRPGVPPNQTMRAGRNPAGGGGNGGATMSSQTAPKSAMDALNAALSRR